jgi:hypothetical protein
MKMILIVSTCVLNLLLFGCTVKYSANPISIQKIDRKEICVIEETEAERYFSQLYKKALEEKGFSVKILSYGSDVAACPLSSTYRSVWSWDFVTYISNAQIFVFRNGVLAGNALYEAPCCGTSLTFKIYEKTEHKIAKMVDQLFPDTEKLDKK